MRRVVFLGVVLISCVVGVFGERAAADIFGSGADTFEIEFVRIGSPGNPPDANPNPAGAVPYKYRIGKYEVSEQMIDKANALGGLGIMKDTRGPDMPATSITWYEAAQFVNWLNTSTGDFPAYKFDAGGNFHLWAPGDPGYNPNNLYRNRRARYFLPSIHEWHKAAFYDPLAGVYYDYPTGSDAVPDGIDLPGDPNFEAVFNDGGNNGGPNDITNVGLLSPYGTNGQGGNVREWEETAFDRLNNEPDEQRRLPGGSWGGVHTLMNGTNTLIGIGPLFDASFVGLRVASVIPEPSALLLAGIGFILVQGLRRRTRG